MLDCRCYFTSCFVWWLWVQSEHSRWDWSWEGAPSEDDGHIEIDSSGNSPLQATKTQQDTKTDPLQQTYEAVSWVLENGESCFITPTLRYCRLISDSATWESSVTYIPVYCSYNMWHVNTCKLKCWVTSIDKTRDDLLLEWEKRWAYILCILTASVF